jgi:transposase
MSTTIHALVDALGNPLAFFLTGGEVHDLVGADHLLPTMQADTLIADKARPHVRPRQGVTRLTVCRLNEGCIGGSGAEPHA